jgi:hypothetical protein
MFGGTVGRSTNPTAGDVLSGNITSGSLGATHLSDASLRASHHASGCVVSGSIASGQVGGNAVASGSVARSHLASGLLQDAVNYEITGIASGLKGSVVIPHAGLITSVTLLSDQSGGGCFVGIWKDTFANFPATSGDTIAPSGVPLISGAVRSTYSGTAALSGWTTAVAAGDVLTFAVHSGLTMTRVGVAVRLGVGD